MIATVGVSNEGMATQRLFRRIFMLRVSRQFGQAVGLVLALVLGWGAPVGAQAQPRFDILEYEVLGNSLLPDATIEQAVTPFLGEGRALGDVDAARAALLQRYQDAGYLSVQVLIPEQKVDGGVVRLQVVEAPVGDVRVLGAQFNAPSRIAAELPAAKVGSVPNFAQLQTQLAEINRRADVKVSPVLKAGRAPGTVDVQLDVDDQSAVHGSVELNNRQSLNTSPTRLAAALRYDDLWARGHSVGLNLQTTPEDTRQVRSLSANYSWPTGPQVGLQRLCGQLAQQHECAHHPGRYGRGGQHRHCGFALQPALGQPGGRAANRILQPGPPPDAWHHPTAEIGRAHV